MKRLSKSQVLFLAQRMFDRARDNHKRSKSKWRILVLARARCMDTKGRLEAQS